MEVATMLFVRYGQVGRDRSTTVRLPWSFRKIGKARFDWSACTVMC